MINPREILDISIANEADDAFIAHEQTVSEINQLNEQKNIMQKTANKVIEQIINDLQDSKAYTPLEKAAFAAVAYRPELPADLNQFQELAETAHEKLTRLDTVLNEGFQPMLAFTVSDAPWHEGLHDYSFRYSNGNGLEITDVGADAPKDLFIDASRRYVISIDEQRADTRYMRSFIRNFHESTIVQDLHPGDLLEFASGTESAGHDIMFYREPGIIKGHLLVGDEVHDFFKKADGNDRVERLLGHATLMGYKLD